MTLFIQNDATGAGGGNLAPNQAAVDLAIVANGDTGLGLNPQVGNRQQVAYAQTLPGPPPTRLGNLVNTNFNPDYGLGLGPQNVDIVVLPVLANFVLNDGTSILTVGGTALPPSNSGLTGAVFNNTTDCLVIYDTTQNNGNGYCTARAGTGGALDLQTPNPIILYHELSHAFRDVTNTPLALTAACNPSSPEENAAITDENDLRTQTANAAGVPVVLRDPGIHCGAVCSGGSDGSCCIIASVASGSPLSEEVAALRMVRDGLIRKSEVGFAFFRLLLRDYYGFSPQVCTLMARRPALQRFILEGYVQPLVSCLRLIEQYALGVVSAVTLGEQFAADHTDRSISEARLSLLRRGRNLLSGDADDLTDDIQRGLAQLLRPALVSEHVWWALVEPLEFYLEALQAQLDGCPTDQLSVQLDAAISSWAAQMPLDGIWAALSVTELREELDLLERTLLRTAASRIKFRGRLKSRFATVTAVATVLDETASEVGED